MYGAPNDEEYIETSYAPSSRAHCRGCDVNIAKSNIRITHFARIEEHYLTQFHYHVNCFPVTQCLVGMDINKVLTVSALNKKDQQCVRNKLQTLQNAMSSKVTQKGTKAATKQKQKTQKIIEIVDEENEPEVQIQKVVRKSAKKVTGYTAKQKKEILEKQEELQPLIMYELQEMLRFNDQKCSGNKQEIIERIADCIVLGTIPKCPKCSGGRLKFIPDEGIYQCPGYMDDTHFKRCNSKFQMGEITRGEWLE